MQKTRKEIRLMANEENLKPPTTSEARKRGKKGDNAKNKKGN
nr:MAG TPA_asm: hypothetical protein [Caudoviricetes sp.]